MSNNNDFDLLLPGDCNQLPEQHSQRTPECPPLSLYIRCASTDWPEELLAHARSCAYCQKSREATWSMECPGLKVLQSYLRDPTYEDRMAVEWHLGWAGCDACAARLELLQETGARQDLSGDWHTLLSETAGEVPTALAGVRPKIHAIGQLNTLPMTLTVEERDGSLVVQVNTTNPNLARKEIEIRLLGERFESRCELSLERVSEEECRAETTVTSSEERLRDLLGKSMLSVRVCEELDRADEEAPSPIQDSGEDVAPARAISLPNSAKVTVIRSGKKPSTRSFQTLAAAAHARTEPGWPMEVEISVAGGAAPVQLRFHLTARNIAVELINPDERRPVRLAARNLAIDVCQVTANRRIVAPEGLFKLHSQSTEGEITQALLVAGLEVQVE